MVVTAGNHDSPSFLDVPKELLSALNVHVVGAVSDDPADEVIVLTGEQREPRAIVCAVAEQQRAVFEKTGHPDLPVIAMGHLFTAGGKTVDGDGVRELYVGGHWPMWAGRCSRGASITWPWACPKWLPARFGWIPCSWTRGSAPWMKRPWRPPWTPCLAFIRTANSSGSSPISRHCGTASLEVK
ncbi:MAG: hypothetical protein K9K40_08945 [Desulfotignum sp.]|nr:hypothetical protein [Desulfotignum sp.]MCF8126703.1 hypothetical protein [Desulfotignum sp.]